MTLYMESPMHNHKSGKALTKSKKNRLILKGLELTVITIATWLNPGAVWSIAVLKVCFFVLLELVQSDEDA